MSVHSTNPRHRRRVRGVLAVAVTAALCSTTAADAADHVRSPHPRKLHLKPSATASRDTIDVKFVEGADVRLRGNRLVTAQRCTRSPPSTTCSGVSPASRPDRLFASATEHELAPSRLDARDRSGRPQIDLGLFFRIRDPRAPETPRRCWTR